MNELHEEFEQQGLSIVGVTGETKEKTEPWVEQHKMQYDFGYLSKESLTPWMKSLGMRGYPSAALVDPKGTVVWTGHPASLNGSIIKKHLKGAEKTPVDVTAIAGKWPKEAVHVRSAFMSDKLGKALEEANKLPKEWTVAGDIERVIDGRIAKLASIHKSGDLLSFTEAMKDASKSLDGVAKLADLEATLAALLKDPEAKNVISGQKKLAKLEDDVADIRKKKDADAVEKKIRKLMEKYPGTFVETAANKMLEKVSHARDHMH